MGQVFPSLNPSIWDIPNIGGWQSKVGGVQRMMTQPCNPDATMSAFAMWNAAPILIWSLVGPDCLDMVADRAGGGHRRRRGLRWKDAGIIPGAGTGTGLGWATFKIGSLGQRAGWYFAIADAGTDFLLNWMSLAMIYDGCQGAGDMYANGWTDPEGIPLIFPGLWLPLSFHNWDFVGMVGAGSTVAVPAGVSPSFSIDGYLSQAEGVPPPAGFEMRVQELGSGRTAWQGEGDDPYGSGILQMGGVANVDPGFSGGNLRAEYRMLNGGIFNGSFNVGGTQNPGGWPTIAGAPCASNIKTDMNWSEYWEQFVDPLL